MRSTSVASRVAPRLAARELRVLSGSGKRHEDTHSDGLAIRRPTTNFGAA